MVATLTPAARVHVRSAAKAPERRWVPCLPTLWPRMLRPNRGMPAAPFPFSAPAARRYYFARNAVFHGMRLLGLDGTEALVPAYHHGVEVEALVAAGVTPRFVRVDARMRLDLEALEAAIGPRTRSIYVIHYAGFPQPMAELAAIARRRGLSLVEDCALSLLSRDGDVPLGSSGELGIFCLYKTVPVPNGGLLVRNDGAAVLPPPPKPAPLVSSVHHAGGSLLANAAFRAGETGQAVRQLVRGGVRAVRHASHVRHVSTGTMHFDRADVDLGMSGLSELVLGNLDFDQIVAARRRNYFLLLGRLRELAPPIFSELPAGVCPLFYPLLCDDKRAVKERLAARGVETVDFWSTGHPGCDLASFPEVAALRRRVLELPNHQDLEPEDMAYIARAVEECL